MSRRPRLWACPYCGSDDPPRRVSFTVPAGWVGFAVMLATAVPSLVIGFFFFPCCLGLVFPALCWVPLLFRETQLRCRDCRQTVRPA